MNRSGDGAGLPAAERADELVLEVEAIRGDLGDLVGELGRRRHDAFDVRRQLRRHPVFVVSVAVACLGLVGAGVAFGLGRRRRRRSLVGRVVRLRRALARGAVHPERIAREATLGRKIAGAGGSAIASVLARRVATRLLSGKR